MRLKPFLAIRIFLFGFFAIASAFFAVPHAAGQTSATLTGTLTDPRGAAIAHAEITASLIFGRDVVARGESATDGTFRLTLPPGIYRVRITADSFQAVEQALTLAPGETRTWNLRLELEPLSAHVVVSAEAQPAPAETAPSLVDVLTRQDIDDRQEIWLTPLLASVPGVSYSRLGPFGGVTTLFLDGGNSNFTKILVDGAPVNVSEPGFSPDFSNLTADNIDKIEIVHGASSALYGSDAMSGVVQIFTHRGATRTPQLTLEGNGGTFDTGQGRGQLSGLLGAFDYSLGAGYFSTGGQGTGDYFRDTTLSGNFGWKFSDADSLRLTLRNSASDAGQPGQTLLSSQSIFAVSPGEHSDLHDFSSSLAWKFASGDHWQNQLLGYESRFQDTLDIPQFAFTSVSKFNRAGITGQSTYLFSGGEVTGGYLFESETGGVKERHDHAGYLEARYQFGHRLNLIAGERTEANDSYGIRVVPRTGASYALRFGRGFWGATRLRASFGKGILEPPLFPADCTPVLKPEQSTTVDAGIDQFLASDRVRLSVTYFHNDFRDIVSFAFGAGSPNCPAFGGSFFNTDKARAFGANSSIEVKATRWLNVAGTYAYDDSKVLVSPNASDPALVPGNQLLKRPLHSANLTLNAHLRRINWNISGHFVGRRTDSDFLGLGITRDPGYFRLDMAMVVPLRYGLSMTSQFENLLDRRYQDAVGYPALGFNYRVGMKYTWGGE
ncbi:MAG: TonB-dependent receptor [Candidatus Acidiferrales bacterium]